MIHSTTKRWLAVAGFFGVQGLLLHVARWTTDLPDPVEPYLGALGLGWLIAATCWSPLWWALHEARGWRRWIELMLAVAAFAWPTILTETLIEALWPSPPQPPSSNVFQIDGDAIGQFIVALLISLAIVSGIVLAVARWISRWRIARLAEEDIGAEQVSLRELMLGMALFGGHLWAFQSLLRAMFAWDWTDIRNWTLAAAIAAFSPIVLGFSLLMLSVVRLALGVSWRSPAAMVMWVVSFLGIFVALVMGEKQHEALPGTLLLSVGVSANAILGGLYWRKLGWRMRGRPPKASPENLPKTSCEKS
jgi:hypothetical protein